MTLDQALTYLGFPVIYATDGGDQHGTLTGIIAGPDGPQCTFSGQDQGAAVDASMLRGDSIALDGLVSGLTSQRDNLSARVTEMTAKIATASGLLGGLQDVQQ